MSPSRRGIVIGAAALLGCWRPPAPPSNGHASELCKTRRGGLLVRDACKAREQKLDAAALGALGLRGPAGRRADRTARAAACHVVDANGSDVGIVTALANGYYGPVRATSARERVRGRARSANSSSSPSRPRRGHVGVRLQQLLRAPSSRRRIARAEVRAVRVRNCSSSAGAFLFTRVDVGVNASAAFTRGGRSSSGATSSGRSSTFGSIDRRGVARMRRRRRHAARFRHAVRGRAFCGDCCRPASDVGVAPVHEIDFEPRGHAAVPAEPLTS
jgi:hypothetical protein